MRIIIIILHAVYIARWLLRYKLYCLSRSSFFLPSVTVRIATQVINHSLSVFHQSVTRKKKLTCEKRKCKREAEKVCMCVCIHLDGDGSGENYVHTRKKVKLTGEIGKNTSAINSTVLNEGMRYRRGIYKLCTITTLSLLFWLICSTLREN